VLSSGFGVWDSSGVVEIDDAVSFPANYPRSAVFFSIVGKLMKFCRPRHVIVAESP